VKEDITNEKVTLKIPLTSEGGLLSKSYREKNTVTYDTTKQTLPEEYMISEELMQGTDLLTGVFVVLPLIVQNKCIGIAIADNHLSKRTITKETSEFLKIVVNQAAVAIENIALYSKLKKYAEDLETTDHLTQVYTFSYFKDLLRDSIKESEKTDARFTLGIVYIENFSVYNERNGHRAGDMALKRIAGILSGTVRDVDVVSRCYGAEFGIIFKNINEDDAVSELKNIESKIKEGEFKGLEQLEKKSFEVKLAAKAYDINDSLTSDEFFKKVEDMV